MDLQSLGRRGVEFHRKGQLAEAEGIYRQILDADPGNFNAHYLLGVVRQQQGRNAEALEMIGAALAVNPNVPDALSNYGLVLEALGRPGEALASYDRALAIKPDFAGALSNRGNALQSLKRFDEALESYERALALAPGFAEAWNNHGNALRRLERVAEALESYERALAINSGFVMAWNNRGIALTDLARIADALASFDRALAIDPNYAEAWNSRGNVLQGQRRLAEALASYERAIAIRPDHAEAWNNRGRTLWQMKRLDEALASYDQAVALRPDYAEALSNRSNIQWAEYRRHEPAVRDLERALAIDPDLDYAPGDLLHLKMHGADWRGHDEDVARIDAGVRAGKRIVRPVVYMSISQSPADLQACAVIHSDHRHPPAPAIWKNTQRRRDRLRVGYVAREFRAQPTAFLTAELFELHDRGKFEIIAFDDGWDDGSAMRRRLEAAFDKFVDISNLPDRAASEKILDEDIDILVNLGGYFGEYRLAVFACKPAPIQVNYLHFPGTLGARYFDYFIADRILVPENERQFYTEKVVWLPDSYQVNDSRRPVAAIPTRAECGLPENAFVFCNFNQSYKLTPASFASWMGILRQVEGSVLWLFENNPPFPENLRRAAEGHGVTPERLIFAPPKPYDAHLARLRLADLSLDSLPYNAHTTASDALWSGLPIITCRGHAFPGRVAASLLHAVGLPELVTENMKEYESLALRLARDPAALRAVREKLEKNRRTAPLFDTDRSRRHIESAYATMWEIFRKGEPARSFNVEPLGPAAMASDAPGR